MDKFEKLPQLKDLRGKTTSNGAYTDYGVACKTDIAIHHSLTKSGSSAAFANFHVGTNGWPGVAYHFVILKDGTIEWNHNLGVKSYHVGDSNKFAVGICVVGDFRTEKLTKEQEESLRDLHSVLTCDLPNYKRTRGHNEFPGYAWKECPVFDYKAVLAIKAEAKPKETQADAKLLEVLVDSLHTYKTADWSDKEGAPIVNKGDVFTIKRSLTVAGSKMYQLKSGLYITANPKYVRVKG